MGQCQHRSSKQRATLKWFARGRHPKAPHTHLIKLGRARRERATAAGKKEPVRTNGSEPEEGKGPEEGEGEQQLKELEELEREAARELQQAGNGEPNEGKEQKEYEDEEVFSFSD
jgi:hypothetical protein